MNTQEIPSAEWPRFCETFTEANRGSLVTVEMIDADGLKTTVARDVPLEKMTLDKTDACNDVLSFSLGSKRQKRINHSVIDPIDLLIKQTSNGNKLLQLRAENGTTLVTFHSGRLPLLKTIRGKKTSRQTIL